MTRIMRSDGFSWTFLLRISEEVDKHVSLVRSEKIWVQLLFRGVTENLDDRFISLDAHLFDSLLVFRVFYILFLFDVKDV